MVCNYVLLETSFITCKYVLPNTGILAELKASGTNTIMPADIIKRQLFKHFGCICYYKMLLIRKIATPNEFNKYFNACMAVCSLPALGVQHSALGGQIPMALQAFVPGKVVTFNSGLVILSPIKNC